MFYKNISSDKEKEFTIRTHHKLLMSNKNDDEDSYESDVAELSKEGDILFKNFLINKLLSFLCLAGR